MGGFNQENAPAYFSSGRAFIGMILLVILIPAYISACWIYGTRRSLVLAAELDTNFGVKLSQIITTFPRGLFLTFMFVGFLFAIVFNVPGNGLNFFSTTSAEQATILGQILIWSLLCGFVAVRFRIAKGFHDASCSIPIDIFEPSNLRPFAQIGLIDVLTFTGGLVITTVQSLDFSFRLDNYAKALAVVLPAMTFLAVYPMWTVHRRMAEQRDHDLIELDKLILAAPKSLDIERVNQLEVLLQRRERVRQASTWPMDIGTLQRFLFYIIIPPLAWVGAALVESVIDGLIR